MAGAFNITANVTLGKKVIGLSPAVRQIQQQLGSIKASLNLRLDNKSVQQITKANAELQNLSKTLSQIDPKAKSVAASIRQIGNSARSVSSATNSLNKVSSNVTKANTSVKATNASLKQTKKAAKEAATEIEEFGRITGRAVRRFAAFSIGTGVVFGFVRAIGSAVKASVEFEREAIKIAQITRGTTKSIQGLTDAVGDLSVALGVDSAELIKIAKTFAQTGISINEVEKALKAVAKASLLPTFNDMNKATEGLIATMQTFQIQAGQFESVLGSINAVSAKFAVESDDIIQAIRRTGAVFASASKGLVEPREALNQLIGTFTSIRATTRESAESIATGLRTIFTRVQRGSTIERLRELGIELEDTEGNFIGAFKAVQVLSKALSGLSPLDARRREISELIGGFRQIGKTIPLIDGFSRAVDATRTAQEGSKEVTRDVELAQQSLANQLEKTRQNWQQLIRELTNSTAFKAAAKTILGVANALIDLARSLKEVIPLLGTVLLARGAKGAFGLSRSFFRGLGQGKTTGFNTGGLVPGRGPNRDTVNAKLTKGEFVIQRDAVDAIGVPSLRRLNMLKKNGRQGQIGFNTGGFVDDLLKGPLGSGRATKSTKTQIANLDKALDKVVKQAESQPVPSEKGRRTRSDAIRDFELGPTQEDIRQAEKQQFTRSKNAKRLAKIERTTAKRQEQAARARQREFAKIPTGTATPIKQIPGGQFVPANAPTSNLGRIAPPALIASAQVPKFIPTSEAQAGAAQVLSAKVRAQNNQRAGALRQRQEERTQRIQDAADRNLARREDQNRRIKLANTARVNARGPQIGPQLPSRGTAASAQRIVALARQQGAAAPLIGPVNRSVGFGAEFDRRFAASPLGRRSGIIQASGIGLPARQGLLRRGLGRLGGGARGLLGGGSRIGGSINRLLGGGSGESGFRRFGAAAGNLSIPLLLAGGFISGNSSSPLGKAAGSALSGAGVGATLGSVFGPIGTGVGALAGGLIGGIDSFFNAQTAEAVEREQQALADSSKELSEAFSGLDKSTESVERFTKALNVQVSNIAASGFAQGQGNAIGRGGGVLRGLLTGETGRGELGAQGGILSAVADVGIGLATGDTNAARLGRLALGPLGLLLEGVNQVGNVFGSDEALKESSLRQEAELFRSRGQETSALAQQATPIVEKFIRDEIAKGRSAADILSGDSGEDLRLQFALRDVDTAAAFERRKAASRATIADNTAAQIRFRELSGPVSEDDKLAIAAEEERKVLRAISKEFIDSSKAAQEYAEEQEKIRIESEKSALVAFEFATKIKALKREFETFGAGINRLSEEVNSGLQGALNRSSAGGLNLVTGARSSQRNVFRNIDAFTDAEVAGATGVLRTSGGASGNNLAQVIETQRLIQNLLPSLEQRASAALSDRDDTTDAESIITASLSSLFAGVGIDFGSEIGKQLEEELENSIGGLDFIRSGGLQDIINSVFADTGALQTAADLQDLLNQKLQLSAQAIEKESQLRQQVNQQLDRAAGVRATGRLRIAEIREQLGGRAVSIQERLNPLNTQLNRLGQRAGLDAVDRRDPRAITARAVGLQRQIQDFGPATTAGQQEELRALREQFQSAQQALELIASNTDEIAAIEKDIQRREAQKQQAQGLLGAVAGAGPEEKFRLRQQIDLARRAGRGERVRADQVADAEAGFDLLEQASLNEKERRRVQQGRAEFLRRQGEGFLAQEFGDRRAGEIGRRAVGPGGARREAREALENAVEKQAEATEGLAEIVAQQIPSAIDAFTAAINKLTTQLEKGLPRNSGGIIPGGGPNRDSVLAHLTPGEFVVNRNATQRNLGLLHAINNNVPAFNNGGSVGASGPALMDMQSMVDLANALNNINIPSSITMKGAHTVEVNVNGIGGLESGLRQFIMSEVDKAIGKHVKINPVTGETDEPVGGVISSGGMVG